jgi:hypothetical protein
MLVVKSVPRAVRSKSLFAALSVLLMIAATLFGANMASGDEVWHQSYQRASQSEECVAQAGETPWQDSWGTNPGWSPSWAKWANNGQGGWVCNRSITWAQTPAASSSSGGSSSVTYAVGDIGPGGGLVFYIDGASGLRYEMAPKNWGAGSAIDPTAVWTTNAPFCYASGSSTPANQNCQTNNLYPETTSGAQTASTTASTAMGMGSVNTAAIKARMVEGSVSSSAYAAGLASAYAGVDGLTTDWYLPSKDELNAMYGYRGSIVDTATYGFAEGVSDYYWSSSQNNFADGAWARGFGNGYADYDSKANAQRVRPIRAF